MGRWAVCGGRSTREGKIQSVFSLFLTQCLQHFHCGVLSLFMTANGEFRRIFGDNEGGVQINFPVDS